MSGEEYRELGYYPYIIDDIALDISRICPTFGKVLSVSNRLIERFNYYRSGDIGFEELNASCLDWFKEMMDSGWMPTLDSMKDGLLIEESKLIEELEDID